MARSDDQLAYLRSRMADCVRCALHRSRSQVVPGIGFHDADVMVVGEAPGAVEDRLGRPFVGPSGRLLDDWLKTLGLQRKEVYVTNVCKCRPVDNRNPYPIEEAACAPFLHVEVHLVRPAVLIALGRHASNALTKSRSPLHEVRGRIQTYVHPCTGTEIPVVATYHPSYVLRKGRDLEEPGVLDDLRQALRLTQ